MRGKKGDATDITLFLIMIFFLAVSFIVVLFVNSKLQTVIGTTVLNQSDSATTIYSAFNTINTITVQRAFVVMFALFIIGIMVSAFMVRVHPAFIFIYIITLSFAIFIAVYLANTYQMIIETEQLATIASQQTMITYIMQHIIKILVGVGALSMIIVFSKIFTGGGGASSSEVDL